MTQADAGEMYGRGMDSSDENVQAISNKESADLFKVGTTAVKDAKKIKKENPDLFEKVRRTK